MCHQPPATPRVRAAAKYGVQRVWDSKERYHSFFEMPVSEGTGELGPQMTCLRREKESREEERQEGGEVFAKFLHTQPERWGKTRRELCLTSPSSIFSSD